MALDVGLGQHVEAVAVAEVVEHGVVGVVRCAHGIDVQPLHGADVLLHLLGGDGTAVDGREVVAVDTVEHHAPPVDGEGAVAADGHLAEAHLAASDVVDVAGIVLQRQHEVVEVGRLSTPQAGGCYVHCKRSGGLPKPLRRRGCLVTCIGEGGCGGSNDCPIV